jgi:hypothetical protein
MEALLMRKRMLTLILVALFSVSGMSMKVFAEGEINATSSDVLAENSAVSQTTFKEEAGITPDSIFYPVDKFLDEVKVILSFSDGSKVEALLDIATERLGESEVMIEEGKTVEAQEALETYENAITEAGDKLEEIVTENADSEDVKVGEQIADLGEQITQQQEDSIKVLEGMNEQVSDEAKVVLSKVIEMQTAKKEAVKVMVEARHELNKAKKDYNEAKVSMKKAEKTGDTEAINAAQEKLLTIEEEYNLKKEEYNTAFEEKQETIKKYSGNEKQTDNSKEEDKKIEESKEKTEVPETNATIQTLTDSAKIAETTKKATENIKDDKKPSVAEKDKEKEKVEMATENKQEPKKEDTKQQEVKENKQTKEKNEKVTEAQNKSNEKGKK